MNLLFYYYYLTKDWILCNFGNYFSNNSKNETLLKDLLKEANDNPNNPNNPNNPDNPDN